MKGIAVTLTRLAFCTALSVLLLGGTAHGGAWTAKKGGMYHKLAFNYYSADENYNSDGDKVDFPENGSYTDTNLNYYIEYGVIDSLTVSSSIFYKRLNHEKDNGDMETSGVSDIDVALKYNLFNISRYVVSVQGLLKIPETYDKDDWPPLGSGQYDYEFRLLFGASFYPHIPGYGNVEIGYRFRTEEPADEFKYLLEFGMNIYGGTYGRVKLDGTHGMDNADTMADHFGNQSTAYDTSYGKVDCALGYKITENWAVEAGYVMEAYGENANAGKTFSMALILGID